MLLVVFVEALALITSREPAYSWVAFSFSPSSQRSVQMMQILQGSRFSGLRRSAALTYSGPGFWGDCFAKASSSVCSHVSAMGLLRPSFCIGLRKCKRYVLSLHFLCRFSVPLGSKWFCSNDYLFRHSNSRTRLAFSRLDQSYCRGGTFWKSSDADGCVAVAKLYGEREMARLTWQRSEQFCYLVRLWAEEAYPSMLSYRGRDLVAR